MDSYYTRVHNLKYQFNTLPTNYIILTIHSYKDESSTTRIHKAYNNEISVRFRMTIDTLFDQDSKLWTFNIDYILRHDVVSLL